MRSTFEPLGKYIRPVDERNTEMATKTVLGINIDKYFMPSVANVIGTDLRNYKLLRKGRFACNPMHVGRDRRLPVAKYTENIPAIVSPAYFMFEIINENEIEPDYLMLCFRHPDFDRMCWFRTDTSVRGGISLEDICALTIPVLPLHEQRKIVHDYMVISSRIEILKKINKNLANQANSIFTMICLIPDDINEWPEGCFNDLLTSNISGDWGSDTNEKNNTKRVRCIRGTDIPDISCGITDKVPTRFILKKNYDSKRLGENSFVIEISGGSPIQSTGRIALLTTEILEKIDGDVICSNFCRGLTVNIDYLYYFYMLWQHLYQNNRLFDYENSTIGLKNFDFSSFVKQEIIKIPPIHITQKLNKIISPLHRMIITNGFELSYLEKIQQLILQHLIQG